MKIFGYELRREQKGQQFETVLEQLIAARESAGTVVTPENCMQSPTVHGIVSAVADRMSVTPVHVYEKTTKNGRDSKEKLPDHSVARLLAYPNKWQVPTSFWADATSCLMRWGNFYAFKSRGTTGPIRELIPLHPSVVEPVQDDNWNVRYKVTLPGGEKREYAPSQILHVRSSARDFLKGDSPIRDIAQSIALEIAAEKFGASFFDNGALPLLVFNYMQGTKGFQTKEQEEEFISSFQRAFGGKNRNKAMLLPKGLELGDPLVFDAEKSQMGELRARQRTIIAGAFKFPPHMIGHLEGSTYTIEQQDQDFVTNVVMPVARAFESAMERDLLTDEDWSNGIVIRFNLDAIQRADFKSRQDGLAVQRQYGVISADEWREIEGRNPLASDDGGDEYWRPANILVAGEPVPAVQPPKPAPLPADDVSKAISRLYAAGKTT